MRVASQPMNVAQPERTGLVHEAFFYLDVQDYAAGIAAFLRDGFELSEPALVAVPGSHVDVLRSALGPRSASALNGSGS